MDPKNSTIIINANILTMDEHLNAYPNGYVKITDGLIEAVGEDFRSSPEQYKKTHFVFRHPVTYLIFL